MKKIVITSIITIAMVAVSIGLLGCKEMNSNEDSKKISVDISGLLAQLPVESSSSSSSSSQSMSQSSEMSAQVSSPSENDAQSAVKTLMVVPLTYSKHGKPYSSSDFSETTEDDLEDDAINSAGFLQFIQLPTSDSTVELEVPAVSEGWQLVAAATSEKVEAADKLEDANIYYIGFTEQAFQSSEEFNDANPTLELKRHCDQDENNRPKGCATFDDSKEAIVTAAVEIHDVRADGTSLTAAYPIVVRDPQTVNDSSPTAAKAALDALNVVGASNITVYVTHSKSDGKSALCAGLDDTDQTSDFYNQCGGFQLYSRDY